MSTLPGPSAEAWKQAFAHVLAHTTHTPVPMHSKRLSRSHTGQRCGARELVPRRYKYQYHSRQGTQVLMPVTTNDRIPVPH